MVLLTPARERLSSNEKGSDIMTMLRRKYTGLSLFTATAVAAVIGCMVGQTVKRDGESTSAVAQDEGGTKASPTKALANRDVYYPAVPLPPSS